MPTRPFDYDGHHSGHIFRILVETLKQTKAGVSVNISEVAQSSRTTPETVLATLNRLLDIDSGQRVQLTAADRIRLALTAARTGGLEEASKALTWQEFEKFSEFCLEAAGFETQKGVMVRGGARLWQIDLVAIKDRMVLAIDCKHWKSPGYVSKFSRAITHHEQSLKPLIHHLRSSGRFVDGEVRAVGIILTLLEPRRKIVEGVVLASISQLSDFLEHLSPYDPDIPFTKSVAESSIRQGA